MPQLAEFLSTEAQVSRLNLAYNNFGDDAVSTLAGVLLVTEIFITLSLFFVLVALYLTNFFRHFAWK